MNWSHDFNNNRELTEVLVIPIEELSAISHILVSELSKKKVRYMRLFNSKGVDKGRKHTLKKLKKEIDLLSNICSRFI